LNNTVDGQKNIDMVTSIVNYGEDFIVGTSNGLIASTLDVSNVIILEKPIV